VPLNAIYTVFLVHGIERLQLICNCRCWHILLHVFVSASVKLEVSVTSVVLECDGTVIDGDEELLAFAGEIFMCLQDGESWTAAVPITVDTPGRSVPATNSVSDAGGTRLFTLKAVLFFYSDHLCTCICHLTVS
jgi:hypothetical protein